MLLASRVNAWNDERMAAKKAYNVTDGKLVLTMTADERGWYTVTSPIEPSLVTMAKSIPAAFEMADDALKELRAARRDLARKASRLRQTA